jgi:hypothetical protein
LPDFLFVKLGYGLNLHIIVKSTLPGSYVPVRHGGLVYVHCGRGDPVCFCDSEAELGHGTQVVRVNPTYAGNLDSVDPKDGLAARTTHEPIELYTVPLTHGRLPVRNAIKPALSQLLSSEPSYESYEEFLIDAGIPKERIEKR